jgi:hypothetical protein
MSSHKALKRKTKEIDTSDQSAVDIASADSMDASDPPSFTPSTAGGPSARPDQPSGSREERVRDKAYQIWQSEGWPHGRHEAHWSMAEAHVTAEERHEETTELRADAPESTTQESSAQPPKRRTRRKSA